MFSLQFALFAYACVSFSRHFSTFQRWKFVHSKCIAAREQCQMRIHGKTEIYQRQPKIKQETVTFLFFTMPFTNNKMTNKKNERMACVPKKANDGDKMELRAMVKYWVSVFKRAIYEMMRAAMKKKIKVKQNKNERTFTPFYCFGGFSFVRWIYILFTWASDHMLFRMLSFLHASKKFHSLNILYPFFSFIVYCSYCCCRCWGFYFQLFFLSFSAKVFI